LKKIMSYPNINHKITMYDFFPLRLRVDTVGRSFSATNTSSEAIFFLAKRVSPGRNYNDMYVCTRFAKEKRGREWYEAFPECGPLAKDSATKLIRG
jgi:hypothetical protein